MTMITPLELIREGLQTNNIELCREGYAILTGEIVKENGNFAVKVTPAEPPKKRGRKKKTESELDAFEKDLLPVKKNTKKKIQPTTTSPAAIELKTQTQFNDYLDKLQKESLERAISEGGGVVRAKQPIEMKLDGVCNEDAFDKKVIRGDKTPRRPSIEYITKQCPICGQKTEIPSNEVNMYEWEINRTESSKTLYRCPKCSGG